MSKMIKSGIQQKITSRVTIIKTDRQRHKTWIEAKYDVLILVKKNPMTGFEIEIDDNAPTFLTILVFLLLYFCILCGCGRFRNSNASELDRV